jgi:hypothetical protein
MAFTTLIGVYNFFKDELNGKFIRCDEYKNGSSSGQQVPKQIKVINFDMEIAYKDFRNLCEPIYQ